MTGLRPDFLECLSIVGVLYGAEEGGDPQVAIVVVYHVVRVGYGTAPRFAVLLSALPVLAGFLAGTGITLGFLVGNFLLPDMISHRPFGIHAGVLGLAINVTLELTLQRVRGGTEPATRV